MNLKISLAGDLGSGKSTVGELLKNKYGFEKISIGEIQRNMAKELGMNTVAFNKYMETHPEIDNILDEKLKDYENKDGKFLFDSRMAWHFVPSAFSVYMKVNPKTAAERIFKAGRGSEKYSSIEDAIVKIAERRGSEKLRYNKFYGVDITDMNNYDYIAVVDGKTPNEVAEEISTAFERWLKK